MTSGGTAQFPENDSEYYNPYIDRRHSYTGNNDGNMNSARPLHAPSPQRPGRAPELLTPQDAHARSRSSSAQRYTPVQYQQVEYSSSPLNPYRPQFQHHSASYASQPPPELYYPPPRRQHSHPSKFHRRDCTCDCECCYYESEPEFESSAMADTQRKKRRSSKQSASQSHSRQSSRRRHSSTDKMEKSKPLSKKDVIKNYVFGTPIKNY